MEQPLPYPGKRALRGEIADLSADVGGLEAATFGLDLQVQVKHLYYALFRIQEQDRLIAAFQAQLGDFEEVAATRYEVGVGSQQAILKAQVEQTRLHLRRAQLAEERRTALDELARQRQQLDLFRGTLLPQAEIMLEATLSAYNTARTDFLDLLDAERTLFTLRLDEAATYARHLQTLAMLERTLGVASLTDL